MAMEQMILSDHFEIRIKLWLQTENEWNECCFLTSQLKNNFFSSILWVDFNVSIVTERGTIDQLRSASGINIRSPFRSDQITLNRSQNKNSNYKLDQQTELRFLGKKWIFLRGFNRINIQAKFKWRTRFQVMILGKSLEKHGTISDFKSCLHIQSRTRT